MKLFIPPLLRGFLLTKTWFSRRSVRSSIIPWLILGGATHTVAEPVNESVHFAYPTSEGVTWIDSFRGVVTARTGEEPQVVFSETGPDLVAVSGRRLVMAWTDKLFTFPAGSWTPRVTPTDEWIVALGASPKTALAFDSKAGLWRLESDGSWSQQESGIKDRVLGLAWYRGLWVAVGSTQGIELDEDDQDEVEVLRYGGTVQPHWEREQRSPCLWWSTDGVKWQSGSLAVPGYNILTAVACLNGQWLAASVNGTLYGSADGKSWKQVSLLEKTNPWAEIRLVALGGEFLIRYGDERWWRSADGRDWKQVPLAAGARVDAPFMKDGQVYAVGQRKADRRVEVAPLINFSVAPEPNAAELAAIAAKAAEDERVRLAAVAEQARREAEEREKVAAAKEEQEMKFYAEWAVSEARVQGAKDMTELAGNLAKHIEFLLTGPLDETTKANLLTGGMDFVVRFTGARGAANFGHNLKGENLKRWNEKVATFNQQTRAWLKEASSDVVGGQPLPANWSGNAGWKVTPRDKSSLPQAEFIDVVRVRKNLAAGHAGAAYDLTLMYLEGLSVPADRIMQLFWSRVLIATLPDFGQLQGADALKQLVAGKSAIENARQAALILYNNNGVIDGVATQFLLAAADAGAPLALPVIMRKGTSNEKLATINEFIRRHLNRANPPPPLTSLPIGNGMFELKFPPPLTKWDTAKIEQWRPVFEQHRAMSAAIVKLVETMGEDADLEAALKQIATKHPDAWSQRLPKELAEAYNSSMGAAVMLTDRDANFKTDSMRNTLAWTAMMTQIDGANAETWFNRARLVYWSGDPAAGLRAVRMAHALGGRAGVSSLNFKGIGRLKAELSLPPEVRDLPQQGVIDYTLSLLMEASLLGKDYSEGLSKSAAALYRNFGVRLAAVWARADAAEVLPAVYQAHASEIETVRFPSERMEAVQAEYARIQELQKTDVPAARKALETLAAESPLTGLIRQHAVIMLELDRLDVAMADIEGALLLDPKNAFAQRLKTTVQQRLDQRNFLVVKAKTERLDGQLAEARQIFRRGDAVAGKAKLDAILQDDPMHPGALLLLATWQEANKPAAVVETLNKAMVADRKSDVAVARLILALTQQRKIPQALELAKSADVDFPRSSVIAAAREMVSVFSVMLAGQPPMDAARGALPALDNAIVRSPDEALPYAVRAQIHSILGDRKAAVADMLKVVELVDYLPPAGLKQIIALLEQQGMTTEAETVRARLPK